jgi:hypothetical protein
LQQVFLSLHFAQQSSLHLPSLHCSLHLSEHVLQHAAVHFSLSCAKDEDAGAIASIAAMASNMIFFIKIIVDVKNGFIAGILTLYPAAARVVEGAGLSI